MTVQSSFGNPYDVDKKQQAQNGGEADKLAASDAKPAPLDPKQEPLNAETENQAETRKELPVAIKEPQKAIEEPVSDVWSFDKDLVPDIKAALTFGIPMCLTGLIKMFAGMFT